MHTGEPLFGGFDSQDQLFKIVHVLGDLPHHLVLRGTKRDKYYIKSDNARSLHTDSLSASMNTMCSSNEKPKYILALPSQYLPQDEGGFLDYPKPLTLGDIIGVHEGGPKGRRKGEKGHSREQYELFLDFVTQMLKMDPADRVDPHVALEHPFLKAFGQVDIPRSDSATDACNGVDRKASRKSSRKPSADSSLASSGGLANNGRPVSATLEISYKVLSDLSFE
jgi:serine/threonine protein kinase